MSTQKQHNQKKNVLDALKDQLQPLTDAQGSSLTGGFSSTSGEDSDDTIGVNVPCNKNNTSCNDVVGCGAKG